jgi:hypothetical protein
MHMPAPTQPTDEKRPSHRIELSDKVHYVNNTGVTHA